MFLATLVLVSIDSEHDGLEQGIDFRHRHKSTQVRNVAGFRLEKEEKVSIFLCFVIVGKEAFLGVDSVVQAVCNFVLL